jgi:ubiquinone/menaquinone biosynthesis C-methylase UbiE
MEKSKIPKFEKFDRYKANGYKAYNYKMPAVYDNCIWFKVFQVSLWDQEIISEIDKDISLARILDVGCASGRLICKLGMAGAKYLSGNDIAPNIIKVAQQKLQDINIEADLKTADVECNLPWADNSFDYIILSGAIHHFFRPLDALQEIYRVLGDGGKLIVAEPWFPVIIRHALNLWLFFFPHDGDFHFYSPTQMMRLISTVGMNHLDYRKVGNFSYLVTGLKD